MRQRASRDDLLSHLKRNVETRKVPISTGLSRLSSVRQVLSVLSADEAADVTAIDVDKVVDRYFLQSSHDYSLASKASYKSRLQSALDEFTDILSRSPSKAGDFAPEADRPRETSRRAHAVPVPLREGHIVFIEHLPFDLTEAEAKRIANVVLAYAVTE